MSVTYSTVQANGLTTFTASSSLAGVVFFYWFQDGTFLGVNTTGVWSVHLPPGSMATIEAVDSNDGALDPDSIAPAGWPATRTLAFVRSLAATIAQYKIEQQKNGGAWATIGTIADNRSIWLYQFQSPRLDDLASYAWRVTPIDAAGNAGTPVVIAAELIVRTPDAPDFTATLQVSTEMEFANA